MKYNFCTLFDSNYLHKGLATYQSLVNLNIDFHLYILAFDDSCYQFFKEKQLPNITVISLQDFETAELLQKKIKRTRAEYCWTCSSSLIYYCLEKFNLEGCTYIDADLMFFSSPQIAFDEIGNSSIAVTEHIPNGPEKLEGKYCVQFNYFKNSEIGLNAAKWWKDQCLEWCYARYEDGKFGDQKYLEQLEPLFGDVRVIKNIGVGVAPWNAQLYDFSDFGYVSYKGIKERIVFFHFHGTKIERIGNTLVANILDSDITDDLEKNIYIPYLKLIADVFREYLDIGITEYKVVRRSTAKKYFAKLKLSLRNNQLVRFLYYDIFRVKHKGHEKSIILQK